MKLDIIENDFERKSVIRGAKRNDCAVLTAKTPQIYPD